MLYQLLCKGRTWDNTNTRSRFFLTPYFETEEECLQLITFNQHSGYYTPKDFAIRSLDIELDVTS